MENTIDDGKPIDFKETVRKHRQYIFSLSYRLTGQQEEAGDLAQETFLAV